MATRFLCAILLAISIGTPARADGDPAAPGGTLAVLDFSNKISAKEMSPADANYFSDITRGTALKAAPSLKVMTRENLLVLLQANGKDLSSCEGECEVDTGRRIGADFIISGELLKVGSSYKLNLKLHETHNGRMMSGEIASGKTIDELDTNTIAAVQRLLAPLKTGALIVPASPESNRVVPAEQTAPPPSNGSAPPSADSHSAPTPAPLGESDINRHLGFFFRIELGGGYMSTSEGDVTVSGGAGAFGLQAGYSIWENNIFGLQLYDAVAINPGISSSSGSADTSDTSLTALTVGIFYTHYFMPLNFFTSVGLGVSTLSSSVDGNSSSASAGFGLRLAVGKEWWLTDHLGLGGELMFSYASNSDDGNSAGTSVFTVLLSITYN